MACSHERSYILYTDSVSNNCPYTAYPCTSGNEYAAGHCLSCTGTGCSEMGYNSKNFSARGSFTLTLHRSVHFAVSRTDWHKSTTVYNLLVFIYSFFKNWFEVKGNAQFWDRGYLSLLFIFYVFKINIQLMYPLRVEKRIRIKEDFNFFGINRLFQCKD